MMEKPYIITDHQSVCLYHHVLLWLLSIWSIVTVYWECNQTVLTGSKYGFYLKNIVLLVSIVDNVCRPHTRASVQCLPQNYAPTDIYYFSSEIIYLIHLVSLSCQKQVITNLVCVEREVVQYMWGFTLQIQEIMAPIEDAI